MNPITDATVLRSSAKDTFLLLDEQFGDESWLTWDAETLLLHCSQVKEPVAMDKLLAVKSCALNINIPCSKAIAFEKTVTALCNNSCVMDTYQPLFMEEVFYGVQQLQALCQEVLQQACKFTGEIPGYIAAVAKTRGFNVLPKELEFAQDMVTYLTGYSPSADEITLVESLATVAKTAKAALLDKATLDKLSPGTNSQDKVVAQLIGCYVFKPA